MYYEEKVIDGVLCYRNRPNEDFEPMSQKQLTDRVRCLQSELQKHLNEVDVYGQE